MKTYIKKVRKYIIAQVLFDLFGASCLAIAPLLQKWLFDYGLNSSLVTIIVVIVVYFLLQFMYSLTQYFCILFAFKGGIRFETILKRDLFTNIFHMKFTKFREKSIGEYISLQGNDITALEQDYLEPLISSIRSVNMMIVYAVVLFVCIDWRIAITIILLSICAIAVPRCIGKKLAGIRNEYQQKVAEYTTTITDLLEGFTIINSATINQICNKHDKDLYETADKRLAYGKNKSFVLGVSDFMTKAVMIVTFVVVAILYYKGEITVGIGVATLSYVSAFIDPIDSILYNITTMQSMEEVKSKVLAYMSKCVQNNKIPKMKIEEGIAFHNVTFTKEQFRLKNISFHIEKGKKYAIIGKSGAGKSTILKLLMGYEKPDSGSIQIDGMDTDKLDLSKLVSYIDQNEHIYKAGVLENITVFDSYPKEKAELAGQHIASRMITDISGRDQNEDCQSFSGGEKQAICFLRMLAMDCDVVLLDEPFSAIDVKERKQLGQYLLTSNEFKDKTVLFITHHVDEGELSLFDNIIRVENGCVSIENCR